MSAEQTIKRLVRTMTDDELRNINTIVVGRIRILKAQKLKEKKDTLKIGDKVIFKVTKKFSVEPGPWELHRKPGPWEVHRRRVKCRGWDVGVVLSIARSFAQVRVGSKNLKCRISGLEKTNHRLGSWFEKPRQHSWVGKQRQAWPTLIELTSKD